MASKNVEKRNKNYIRPRTKFLDLYGDDLLDVSLDDAWKKPSRIRGKHVRSGAHSTMNAGVTEAENADKAVRRRPHADGSDYLSTRARDFDMPKRKTTPYVVGAVVAVIILAALVACAIVFGGN